MSKRKHDKNMHDSSQVTKRVKVISEDGTVKFDFMTSLKNIAVVKVASILWMSENTKQDIDNLFYTNLNSYSERRVQALEENFRLRCEDHKFFEKWEQIKCYVVAKASELCLPKTVMKMLQNSVQISGKLIYDWIEYLDYNVLNTGKESKYSAIDLFNHLAWTTRGRIDLAETAKNILAYEECFLSYDHMYRIACTYCLEDKISILAPKVVKQYYLNSIRIHELPMVYFWTMRITGDYKALHNLQQANENISNTEFLWILTNYRGTPHTYNTVFLAHLWSKLNEQEKARNVIALIKNVTCEHKDLQYTLLTNLDHQQQQEVFKECSDLILKGISNDWLWEDYFLPVALHALKIMHPNTYTSLMNRIAHMIYEIRHDETKGIYDKYKYFFKNLWQDSCRHLKDYYFDKNRISESILHHFSWEVDMDVIDLIFKDMNNAQLKRDLIFDCDGIDLCQEFIVKDKWDLLKLFMNYTLSCEEDIRELKEKLGSRGKETAYDILLSNSLEDETFDKIERFMTWALESGEAIDRLRRSLVSKPKVPLKSIIESNMENLTKLESLFEWCSKGDPELVNKFKSATLEFSNDEGLLLDLIMKDQYDTLDKLLSWLCLNNEQQIAQVKSDVYKCADFVRLLALRIKKENSIKMLDQFIGWAFSNQQQIQEFKMWLLYSPTSYKNSGWTKFSICADLLKADQFKLADEFVNWCGIPAEAMSPFKNMLIFSSEMLLKIDHACRDNKNVHSLIKWFNPTIDTIEKLKAVSRALGLVCNGGMPFIFLEEFLRKENLLV